MDHLLSLPEGFKLDHYRIVRVLGHGGFGITYLAHDEALKTDVAIKEYFPADLATRTEETSVSPKSRGDEEFFEKGLEYFTREARTVAAYNHPNVIAVKHFFQMHGTGYMVMPYEKGESLAEILGMHGTLDEDEIREILAPLLNALETVHGAGYLHRDIKPGNIYIREDGSPVLIDFGAARVAVGQKSRSLTSFVTEGYAPLELYYTGEDQGPWTDIYQMGATLYRALFGEKPPEAPSRVRTDHLVWATERGAGKYSENLLRGIDAALGVDPDDRPQSVDEWRRLLDLAGNDPEVTRRREQAPAADGAATIVGPDVGATRAGAGEAETYVAGMADAATRREAADAPTGRAPKEAPPPTKAEVERKSSDAKVVVFSSVTAVLLILLGGGGYFAYTGGWLESGPAPIHQCDRLAADRWDPTSITDGVRRIRQADADAAVSACRAALREYPDEARFRAQLARALRAARQFDASAQAAKAAAEAGHPTGMRLYGSLLMSGQGVAKDEAGGFSMLQQAAGLGHVSAQFDVGHAMKYGKGAPKNPARANGLLREAADKGHSGAQYEYGESLRHGIGIDKDPKTAARYYRLAADQDHTDAQVVLSYLYYRGEGVEQSFESSAQWARRAAEQGNRIGEYNLGVLYHNGKGLERDYGEARRWFLLAAEKEYADAHFMLGEMAEHGRGGDVSLAEALFRYKVAERLGAKNAAEAVKRVAGKINLAQRLVGERKAENWRRP